MQYYRIFNSEQETNRRLEHKKPFLLSIGHLKIVLLKMDSSYYAFHANCPHAGASLADGYVNHQGEIVCPLHAYRFRVTDGRETTGQSCELRMYTTEMRTDGFYIGINQN